MNKNVQRLRRAARARAKIRELKALRLSVHRTSQHIYAQIFDVNSKVLAVASTVQKDVRGDLKGTGNIAAAVANDGQRREAELTSALHNLGNAVHRHELFDVLVGRSRFFNSGHLAIPRSS